ILSVFLLAVPPLKSAKDDPLILACIAAGALLSIAGMALRWIADRKTQHRIDRAQDEQPDGLGRGTAGAAAH
ncbi:MAG: hypothetical protein QOH81_708, partial [Sphingomonadales bacterium]|nr:hypothetical protein [Sphingomonadales bacterium]